MKEKTTLQERAKQVLSRNERPTLYILLVCLLAVLFLNIRGGKDYVSPRDRYALSLELNTVKREIEQLKRQKEYLENKLAKSNLAYEDLKIKYEDMIGNETEQLKMIIGEHDLSGPGVVVFISDGVRDLTSGESPNNLLVHDIDIRAILDDLRNAGAEAISVNDERILLERSEIRCVGPTILVNDKLFAPPFVVKAIGDRKLLEASLNAPQSALDLLRGWGLQIEVNTSMYVEIPRYKGGRLK